MGDLLVDSIVPGLFAANSDGRGVGAIGALRVSASGVQTELPTYSYDATQQRFVAVPVSLGAETDKLYLVLYGVGIRGVQNLSDVSVQIGGVTVPVTYAGAQGGFVGLDQINIGPVPRSLLGRGEISVTLVVAGRRTNSVMVNIQ